MAAENAPTTGAFLITGGTKGIGRAIATRLAGPDVTLFLNYRSDVAAAEETAAEVRTRGARCHLLAGDVGDVEALKDLSRRIASEVSRLDGVVHCAVSAERADTLTISADQLGRAVTTNGSSLLLLTQALLPLLGQGCSVCLLSSKGAFRPTDGYVALGPPKALAQSLALYLARDLAPRGVRVNIVSTGPVDTEAAQALFPDFEVPVTPLGRPLRGGDAADLVAFLLSDSAAMITGQELRVDGGLDLR